MSDLQKINHLHKKALKKVKEKIEKIDNNEKCSNSYEKRRVLVETFPLINLIFSEISKNCPREIKGLQINHSSSIPVLEEVGSILNSIGFYIFTTSMKTFSITAFVDTK
ncbi:MAG: hypothetical protein PHP97_00675 [Candidatus Shapirobacteria bacterium]|nr:hypothetical protein [Candidatus Shapirobacteria bacterium]MDD3002395.1 hypothetical protein [Candidatus Shapirobacteria bacterium]MDD4383297.1 hypothetical protein [Candidatus Shapirobacteria bacterium]